MNVEIKDVVRVMDQPARMVQTSNAVDVVTGEPLSPDEIKFRLQIDQEAANGFIAVDTTYASLRLEIHQPMVSEDELVHDGASLALRRPSTGLQLPLSLAESGQESIVELIRHAVGEFPANVMHHLYAIANDPPYYRRNTFRVSISELLDRLGYTRDRRGIHYSTNRKRLTQTLFALYLTSVEVTRRTRNGRGTAAFTARLLSGVGYLTNQDVGALNVRAVFEQGLADVIEVSIEPMWYRGVRGDDGRPGRDYRLLPYPRSPQPSRGRRGPKPGAPHRGQSRTADLLRAYVQRCKEGAQARHIVVTRDALLEHAGITNRNISMAVNTLKKSLGRLVDEGTLSGFQVKPSKVDELMELTWTN